MLSVRNESEDAAKRNCVVSTYCKPLKTIDDPLFTDIFSEKIGMHTRQDRSRGFVTFPGIGCLTQNRSI